MSNENECTYISVQNLNFSEFSPNNFDLVFVDFNISWNFKQNLKTSKISSNFNFSYALDTLTELNSVNCVSELS